MRLIELFGWGIGEFSWIFASKNEKIPNNKWARKAQFVMETLITRGMGLQQLYFTLTILLFNLLHEHIKCENVRIRKIECKTFFSLICVNLNRARMNASIYRMCSRCGWGCVCVCVCVSGRKYGIWKVIYRKRNAPQIASHVFERHNGLPMCVCAHACAKRKNSEFPNEIISIQFKSKSEK